MPQKSHRYKAYLAAIGIFGLLFAAPANADPTLNLSAGTLAVDSTNNEFLLEFTLNDAGSETPYPAFFSSSGLIVGPYSTFNAQSATTTFTFDFSFFVASPAELSENSTYGTFVQSTTSSVSLLQGTTVIDTGIDTGTGSGYANTYSLPTIELQPGTQYDLVVTTLGVPPSEEFTGTTAWGQIALDLNAVAPEPSSLFLFGTGLVVFIAAFRKKLWARNRPS